MTNKIYELIDLGWTLCVKKIAGGLMNPTKEKELQLQLAMIYQGLANMYEETTKESIKILLEEPVKVRNKKKNLIDIVVRHAVGNQTINYPIELKCFRKKTQDLKNNRGAGNLSMFDYWEDIENVELYSNLAGYGLGTQFTVTDDSYYVETKHTGSQVSVYSTSRHKGVVSGPLTHKIANRSGHIPLCGEYDMTRWQTIGNFYAIAQRANGI